MARFMQLVVNAVADVNSRSRSDQRIDASADTVLIGPQSCVDSLQLVMLLAAIESRLNDVCGSAALLEEADLFDLDGPMRSIEALAEYVAALAQKAQAST